MGQRKRKKLKVDLEQITIFNKLPYDIIRLELLQYLSIPEIIRLTHVCKFFNDSIHKNGYYAFLWSEYKIRNSPICGGNERYYIIIIS